MSSLQFAFFFDERAWRLGCSYAVSGSWICSDIAYTLMVMVMDDRIKMNTASNI
jgi:hypothetical protein